MEVIRMSFEIGDKLYSVHDFDMKEIWFDYNKRDVQSMIEQIIKNGPVFVVTNENSVTRLSDEKSIPIKSSHLKDVVNESGIKLKCEEYIEMANALIDKFETAAEALQDVYQIMKQHGMTEMDLFNFDTSLVYAMENIGWNTSSLTC